MSFSAKAIAEMAAAYRALDEKEDALLTSFLSRNFKNKKAEEFASHGLARRIKTLKRCIKNVFNALPPESKALPTRDQLIDATINIQAFVFNAAGVLDNLAWIWVCENSIKNRDGSALHKGQISLTNKAVKRSFSTEFREYLDELEKGKWIENLHTFRHALAHRIPLYIPPYQLPKINEVAYFELDRLKAEAEKKGEWDKLPIFDAKQKKLVVFHPEIRHSLFETNTYSIRFHPQLLADFHTIEELANKMLAELDKPFIAPAVTGNRISRALKFAARQLANILYRLAR